MERVSFKCEDGVELSGRLFAPEQPKATIQLNGATGVLQRFYQSFATMLQEQGYAVLTYDYRGIGDSKSASLKTLKIDKVDWAKLDATAAHAFLKDRYPALPHTVFGHSVGGQLVTLMGGIEEVTSLVTYGASFGYWKGTRPRTYRAFVWLMFYLVIPWSCRLLGFFPASWFKLGEDLPKGVALIWSRWGKCSEYFERDFSKEAFDQLTIPWIAIRATDDSIATKENAEGLLSLYSRAKISELLLEPSDFELSNVGHMGVFSRQRSICWPLLLRAIEQGLSEGKNPH